MKKIAYNDSCIPLIAKIHEEIPMHFGGAIPTSLDISLRQASIELCLQAGDEMIIIDDGELKGFIWYKISDHLHIKSIWVHPDFRRQGIATTLKNFVLNEAKDHNCQSIYGDVDHRNTAMRKLNHHLGYQSDDTRMSIQLEVQSD